MPPIAPAAKRHSARTDGFTTGAQLSSLHLTYKSASGQE
jgi:hypothetical protein